MQLAIKSGKRWTKLKSSIPEPPRERDGHRDCRYRDRAWAGLIIAHDATLSMRTIVETNGVLSRCSNQSGWKSLVRLLKATMKSLITDLLRIKRGGFIYKAR